MEPEVREPEVREPQAEAMSLTEAFSAQSVPPGVGLEHCQLQLS